MNAPVTIINPLDRTSWIERWEACRDTDLEAACLRSIMDEAKAKREDDLANDCLAALDAIAAGDKEMRAEAVSYIEAQFARWEAEEAYEAACYAWEVRTDRLIESSPTLWDKEAWIARKLGEAA